MKILTIFLVLAGSHLLFAATPAGTPIEIQSGKLSLKFDSEGRPKSFKNLANGKQLLNEQDPGPGFEIKGMDVSSGSEVAFQLKELTYDGKQLLASISPNICVRFDVSATDRYLSFKINRVEGIPKKNLLWLQFKMNLQGEAKVFPLDNVTKVSKKGCEIRWPWLWARSANLPMGGFAIYTPSSEAEGMQTFLQMWSKEGMPHQNVQVNWNEESAAKWLDQEQKRFANQNRLFLPPPASPASNKTPVVIGSEKLSLKFDAEGKPESFLAGNRELINLRDPGMGFYLQSYDFDEGKPLIVPFKELHFDGKQLVASMGDKIKAIFDVKATDRYITFRIKRVEGCPNTYPFLMQFKMNTQDYARTRALDYMTESRDSMPKRSGGSVNCWWSWLWSPNKDSILGGFALFAPSSLEEEDETLLQLWVNEGIPHPKVKGEWTMEKAREWLAEWQKKFADESTMQITAKSNQDLYTLADYAAKMDMKGIYMHTDTWCGEYWPSKYSCFHLKPETFPNGEADFLKFANYTKSKGIGLTIHTVSCSIADEDPDYIAGKIDPRLAKWVEGTLVKPVSESDKTIYFKPAPGAEFPFFTIGPSVTGPFFAHSNTVTVNVMYLDNEFIKVGKFTEIDQDVWVLKDCSRGQIKSKPMAHGANTSMFGTLRPYGQVFTADVNTSLVTELGRRQAEFNNRNNITHCEQDAAEIHMGWRPWGYAKFAEAVYSNLDHPTTSNNSGGKTMPCHFEYLFNSSKTILASRHQPRIPLTLARNGRLATGPYEMFSLVAKPIAKGGRDLGIQKPEPMFGVTSEILENHGLTSFAAEGLKTWKKVARSLTDEQRKTILSSTEDTIYRATKNGEDCELTPLRMLYRPKIEIIWRYGSEFGPVVPRQYLKTGELLQVENPYADQEPEFVIRVMSGFNEDLNAKIKDTAKNSGDSKEKAFIDSYNIGTGVKNEALPVQSGSQQQLVVQPRVKSIRNLGDHLFSDEGEGIRIQFENKRNELITNDKSLPYFDCSSDMSEARGLGLTVTGDGSGAVLVLQPYMKGQRDYIVPIDFTGTREIIIPCGEVSWGDARWGWYMRTKGTQYGKLSRMAIGLGEVPKKTTVDIKVSHLRVLPEVPASLINPVIKVGSGSMQITGTIRSESYLWYQGGDSLGVYDANWKKLADIPVKKDRFVAPKGSLQIGVESKDSPVIPWLESQFFVKGTPMKVPPKSLQ